MGNWEPRGAVGEGQASQRAHLPAAQGVGRGAGGDEAGVTGRAGGWWRALMPGAGVWIFLRGIRSWRSFFSGKAGKKAEGSWAGN